MVSSERLEKWGIDFGISGLKGKNFMLNPIALKEAKIAYNFGLSECNRIKAFQKSLFVVIE